jgi:hypothetical protein
MEKQNWEKEQKKAPKKSDEQRKGSLMTPELITLVMWRKRRVQ